MYIRGRTPLILLPFVALWNLVTAILEMTGRLAAVLIGVALIFAGAVLCLTILGAIVGVPLIILGLTLVVRGLF